MSAMKSSEDETERLRRHLRALSAVNRQLHAQLEGGTRRAVDLARGRDDLLAGDDGADARLSMLSIYANGILSAREAAQETRKSSSNRLWDQRFTTENILDTLEATLTCPPSAPTLASLQAGED